MFSDRKYVLDMYFLLENNGSDDNFYPKTNGSRTKMHARCISVKNRGCRVATIFSDKNREELGPLIFFQKQMVSDAAMVSKVPVSFDR